MLFFNLIVIMLLVDVVIRQLFDYLETSFEAKSNLTP